MLSLRSRQIKDNRRIKNIKIGWEKVKITKASENEEIMTNDSKKVGLLKVREEEENNNHSKVKEKEG